jgi:hypothetical protein
MGVQDWAQARVLSAVFYVPPAGSADGDRTAVCINGSGESVEAFLPEPRKDFVWQRAIDTALEGGAPVAFGTLAPRSVVIFVEVPAEAGAAQR